MQRVYIYIYIFVAYSLDVGYWPYSYANDDNDRVISLTARDGNKSFGTFDETNDGRKQGSTTSNNDDEVAT